MRILSSLKVALRALRTNKMRSFLTMLGIIIGVGAVIVMVAVGNGATENLPAGREYGEQSHHRSSRGDHHKGGPNGWVRSPPLPRRCPGHRGRVSGGSRGGAYLGRGAQVVYGNQNWATGVTGTIPAILVPRLYGGDGRQFSDQEVTGSVKVAVVGPTRGG